MADKIKRNEWLDVIKFFAACMVVFIHVPFSNPVGGLVLSLARFAVPLFFAVAGFFALNADVKTLCKRLTKIVALYVIAAIIYFAFIVVFAIKENGIGSVSQYIINMFSLTSVINYMVFNVPFTYLHLWFLPALIYVYIIWILFRKSNVNDKILFFACMTCLVANLILCEGLSLFNVFIDSKYIRNFLIMGFPFFGLGYFMHKYIDKVKCIKTWVVIFILIFGVCETFLSRYFLAAFDLYLGSVCICIALLTLAIKNSNRKVHPILRKVAMTNTDIYIYHIIIALGGKSVLSALSVPVTSLWFVNIWPIAVCILCVIFSLCKNFVLTKVKDKYGAKVKLLQYIQ